LSAGRPAVRGELGVPERKANDAFDILSASVRGPDEECVMSLFVSPADETSVGEPLLRSSPAVSRLARATPTPAP